MKPRFSKSRLARLGFVVVVAASSVAALFGTSEAKPPRTPPPRPAAAAPKPARPPVPKRPLRDGGVSQDAQASSPGPESREDASVVETKSGDGGKSFRFEALEVEGRLKSPQIVYFLRRVRAEFAAGDLGHRSFSQEMSETRNEPSF